MLKTYKAADRVNGGFYFNTHDWTMRVVAREGEVLPGTPEACYYRFPTVMMLVAAPILSFAFVIFLPFIGLALLTKAGVDKGALVWRHARPVEKLESVAPRVTK